MKTSSRRRTRVQSCAMIRTRLTLIAINRGRFGGQRLQNTIAVAQRLIATTRAMKVIVK